MLARSPRSAPVALAACAVALLAPAGAARAQAVVRGTPAGTNAYPVAPLRAEPRVAWDVKPRYRDSAALAVGGGVLVTGNVNGRGGTFAYDAATGKLRWKLPGQMRGGPVIDGGAAYVVSAVGNNQFRLAKVELKKGKVLWSVTAPELGTETPVVVAGRVFLAHGDHSLTAHDAATGAVLWRQAGLRVCSGALAVADGRVVLAGGLVPPGTPHHTEAPTVTAFDAATGRVVWAATPVPRDCTRAPAIAGDAVLARVRGTLFALDAATGAPRWQQEVVRTRDGRPWYPTLQEVTVVDGVAYTSIPSAILGFDVVTGRQVLELPFTLSEGAGELRMPSAGGVLYVAANNELPRERGAGGGWIYAVDLATRQVLWKFHASRPDGYANKEGTWPTTYMTPVDGGLYVESEQRLVSLRAP